MEQPEGFSTPGQESWVWELHKGLYGMCQSGWIWNKQLNSAMLAWGFTHLMCEWCVYYHHMATNIVAIHINNILSITSSKEENAHFKTQLHSKWTILDLSDVKFALSIGISHD